MARSPPAPHPKDAAHAKDARTRDVKDVPDTPIAAVSDGRRSIEMRRARQPLWAQQKHIDVHVDDVPRASAAAEALGAVRVGTIHADAVGTFQVLQDPEGNEWCVVRSATGG